MIVIQTNIAEKDPQVLWKGQRTQKRKRNREEVKSRSCERKWTKLPDRDEKTKIKIKENRCTY